MERERGERLARQLTVLTDHRKAGGVIGRALHILLIVRPIRPSIHPLRYSTSVYRAQSQREIADVIPTHGPSRGSCLLTQILT